MGALLTFTSPVICVAIDEPTSPPLETAVEGWRAREHYQADSFWFDGEPHGTYHISIEREIQDGEDGGSVYIHGRYLAQDIDHMSVYVTTLPLCGRGFDQLMLPQLPPRGWTTNAETTLHPDQWKLLTDRDAFTPKHRRLSTLPLAPIVKALASYRAADDLTYTVASLHFEALTTWSEEKTFRWFALAIEAIRELLPGQDAKAKQSCLPSLVRSMQRRSLNWLFEMSNTRRNTRHLITKRSGLALHPPMHSEEESDFLHDADLLSRFIVSKHLGLPFIPSED